MQVLLVYMDTVLLLCNTVYALCSLKTCYCRMMFSIVLSCTILKTFCVIQIFDIFLFQVSDSGHSQNLMDLNWTKTNLFSFFIMRIQQLYLQNPATKQTNKQT